MGDAKLLVEDDVRAGREGHQNPRPAKEIDVDNETRQEFVHHEYAEGRGKEMNR